MGLSVVIKDYSVVIASIAALCASLAAIYGINSWRREYRGKKLAELAEEVLCLFYEAQDAIHHIRSPFSRTGEGSTRKQGENETEEEKEAYDHAWVVFERYNTHVELFSKIYTLRYRFRVQFGNEATKPFNDLRTIINEILASARRLGNLWSRYGNHLEVSIQVDAMFEKIQKHESVIWESIPEEDPINLRLEKCVTQIETTCREILSSEDLVSSVFNSSIFNLFRGGNCGKEL